MTSVLVAAVLAGCAPAPVGASAAASTSAAAPRPSAATAATAATGTALPPSPSAVPSGPAPRQVAHVVGWLDEHAGIGTRKGSGRTIPTEIAVAPTCRASDVEVFADAEGGMGHITGTLTVHNVSVAPCSVRGAPELALVDVHGVVYASSSDAAAAGDNDGGEPITTIVLVPNSWAWSSGWYVGSSCGGDGATVTLRVRLPGDDTDVSLPFVHGSAVAKGPCAVDPPPMTTAKPHPGLMRTPPFTTINLQPNYLAGQPMRVRLEAPASVAAGTTLHFRVIADWPDGGGLGYGGPPLYAMRLGEQPPSGDPYVLRWDPVRGGVDGAIAFEMELGVSAETPPGPSTLTWGFVEPELAPVSAPIQVTR